MRASRGPKFRIGFQTVGQDPIPLVPCPIRDMSTKVAGFWWDAEAGLVER